MPATKRKPKLDPAQIYVAWQSFAVALPDGTSPVVKAGTRLRGDDERVTAQPQNFVPDGAGESELLAAMQGADPEGLVALHQGPSLYPAPPPRVRDSDRVVAIRDVGTFAGDWNSGSGQQEFVRAGDGIPKDAPIVKANPDAFLPIVPEGLEAVHARRAKTTMSTTDNKGTRVVYTGQWVPKDHPFVRLHPH